MKRKSICRAVAMAVIITATPAYAASATELLFKGVVQPQTLTAADREAIVALLPIAVQGNELIDTTCKQPSDPNVVLRNLNGEGRMEVIVIEGNSCVYGMVGRTTHLITSDGTGQWRTIFTSGGEGFQIRQAAPGKWPNLMPQVPGFCYPTYGYSEKEKQYVLIGRTPDPKMPKACQNH